MQYRTLPHGGDKISIIGLGMGSIHNAGTQGIVETIHTALDAGVNFFDFVPSDAAAFDGYAQAFKGSTREQALFQIHLGADYSSGKYGWTTDAEIAIPQFEERLRTLGTDYTDFGFIHCIDEEADFDKVMNGGIWDYAQCMKREGVIRHLGFSTHRVSIARRCIATGQMDLGMFSINPMYDYTDESNYGKGEASERAALYKEFEAAGVGISVMKAFAGGQLLDAKASPFSQALTKNQCMQYVLDKPGVLSVLPGVRGRDDLDEVLSFLNASPGERDYSVVGTFAAPKDKGSCVYCNHCQPCPEGIAIGLVNKYYDLARLGDDMAAQHYHNLEKHADDCKHCGHCDSRCPFGVHQSERMIEITSFFS